LLEIPENWANTLRDQFLTPLGIEFYAPTRVTLQPYGDSGWVIHNYNRETVRVELSTEELENGMIEDRFSGKQFEILEGLIKMEIPPRSRLWMEIN